MNNRIIGARKLLFGLLIIGLFATVGSVMHLRSQILDVPDGSDMASGWFVSEIERDFGDFKLSLAKYMLGNETEENLNLRFDLLWSRVVGAGQGEVAAQLARFEIDTSSIERSMALLRRSESLVVNIDTVPSELLQVLLHDFEMLNIQIHDLALDVMQVSAVEGRDWRLALLEVSSATVLLSTIISTVVFF